MSFSDYYKKWKEDNNVTEEIEYNPNLTQAERNEFIEQSMNRRIEDVSNRIRQANANRTQSTTQSQEKSIWDRVQNISNFNNNSKLMLSNNKNTDYRQSILNAGNRNKVLEQETRKSNNLLETLNNKNKTMLFSEKEKQVVPIKENNDEKDKNENILEDAGSLATLVGLGVSTGGKEVFNYIESANENNFDGYKDLKKRQFLTSQKVNEEDKAKAKIQDNLLLSSNGIKTADENRVETNLVKKAIRDSINKDNEKIQEEQNKISNQGMQTLGKIAPSMGQMLPGMALNAVNPILGMTYFTTSAGGGYIDDALNRGMNEQQAFKYGTVMGALEGASESIITGQQLSKVKKAFTGKEISKKLLNSYGFNIFENAVQEAVMEPAQEITAGIIGDKADWSNMGSRMLESGFNGALMGAISNGVTFGLEKSGNVYDKIKNGESITQSEYKEALQENINKFGKDAVENAMKKGATEVYQEVNNLQQQSTQNEQILPTQQITQEQNNVAQNGNTEQILPTQNNVKEDNLKGRSFEDIVDDAMSNYEYNEILSPLKNRNINTIGKETKVNAYQYDNPKVKPYFQEMAQMIGEDIGNIASADNRKTTKGGGTSLSTNTSAIEKLHKEMGYSYDQIIDGIVNIIDDHGKENNALSKKLEIIIDDQLRNGYTNSYGKYINPNQEYINLISNNNSNVTNNQLPTQQTNLPTQEDALNQNIVNNKQLPVQNYQYEKTGNTKIDAMNEQASQYFDNSEKTHNFMNMLSKIVQDKNIEIRFDSNLTDSKGNIANGKYENGVITINPNSNRAGEFIAIHELTHAIGTDSMRNIIENYRKSNKEFDNAVKSLLENYNTTELTDEAMADVSAQLFGNQEYINNLAQENPNLFKRIYNEIKYLWHQFRGYKNQNQFIEDLQYKWEQAYRNNNQLNNTTNYLLSGKKSLTANKNKLNEAMELKQYQKTNKMSDEDIFKKTGWYLGGEGKWKYEINDKNFKLKDNLKANTPYWLEDVFDAPELYQAYPNFKHISVDFLNLPKDIGGGYNKDYGMILNNDILNKNPAEQKKDILHEIQHAIQHEEEFAEGSDSKTWAKRKEELQYSIDSINKDIELIHNAINLEPFRNTLIDRMSKGENIDYWKEIEKFENNSKYAERLKELNNKKEKYIEEYQKIKNRDDFELYQNTAGEQEARDVEVRSTYTDKQRKNILPLVKNDKTVYIRGNNSMKEGASNVDNGSTRHKTHTVEYTGNDNTREYRLPSRDSNTSEGNGIFGDSKQKSTQNQRGSSENIETNNIENSNKSSFSMDNQGRTLSKQQQEYFKDSKVRDENGNLLTMYHSTDADFNTFSYDDLGKTGLAYGQGFYFTDSEKAKNAYGKNTKTVYLDIQKPMEIGKRTMLENDYRKLVEAVDKKTNGQVEADYGSIEDAMQEYQYGGDDIDLVNALKTESGLTNDVFYKLLRDTLGYDGIKANNQTNGQDGNYWIAFNSNQIKNIDNTNPTDNPDIRYSKNNQEWQEYLDKNIESKGTRTNLEEIKLPTKKNILPIKEETNNVQTKTIKEAPVNSPTKGETIDWGEMERPEGKIRKHYRSIIESSNTTAEAKAIAKEMMGLDTYTPQSNESLLQKADSRISTTNPETELNSLLSRVMNNEKVNDVDMAVGERLIEYYSKIGDSEHLQDAIHATALAGTQAGRTVQAMALLNHMTPQGQVVWLERSVNKANKELEQKFKNKKNIPQFELTSDMTEKILNTKSKEEMYKVLDDVYEELGQQVPKTTLEKIDEWRYFSMLANVKTHGRNMIGNVAMNLTQRAKNKVAGAIEGTVAKFNPEMERTHTIVPTSKKVKDFAKNDVKNMDVQTELGMNENKYNPQSRLQSARRTFKSDVLENTLGKMFDLNSKLLEVEDNIGLKSMYVKSLGEYITANKIDIDNMTDAQLSKARQHAIKEAQEATFHQASALATALNQMGRKNNIAKFALDSAVPFKKTPINVAKTGVQYSPVGLIKSAVYDVGKLRKGDITVNQYIDNVSKGLTGTGIAYLGYALAQAGILKASGSDDDKKEKYEEEQGKQSYSIEIGGKTYSLDWLSPVGIPLFIGAEINQQFNTSKKEKNSKSNDDNETLNQIVQSVANIANASANAMNPMSEMSMISGLTSILSSYNKENAVGDMIVNTGKSYINQFVPTALGQLARTTDDYERTTKSTKTGALEKAVDSTINQIKSKIPGLRQTLPTKTDIWGKDVKQSENLPFRAFNNFINPSKVQDVSTDKVDKELNSLYAKTGESSIIPKAIDRTLTIDKTNYRLSNEEYAKYYKNYGKTSYNLIKELISSSDYKNLTDEQKQKAIENVYSYAKESNKLDYAKDNNITVKESTLYKTMNELKDKGGEQSSYINYMASTSGMTKESEKNEVLLNSNYDSKTKSVIYSNGTGKDDNLYNNIKNSNIDINEYLKYKTQDSTGTAKEKIYNYVNSNITGYNNKLLILGSKYKLSRSEQEKLANYIYQISTSVEDKNNLFDYYSKNFTINNGKVYYK